MNTTLSKGKAPISTGVATAARRVPRWGLLVGFVLWTGAISVPLGLFSAAHRAVLPVAKESLQVSSSGEEQWTIVHVLAEDCACSRSVIDYLVDRGPSEAFAEEVTLVGGGSEAAERLRRQGYLVATVEGEQLCADFGSEGVPFFQVVKGGSEPSYSGAYFDGAFRGDAGFQDLRTASRLAAGGFVLSRPVYGCPTSERLKSVLDPFGWK
ncbi:hypothetical protein IEN85_05415 [Pelagicoccus sp. NFK12]|uniref:Uncharacterized protein n=1 Tax=Pelagicoccus enzymogenes TaxID=2773457 RepID=A0A927F5P2_9BACT|nr:hypothetical protein [Pelagicoccus enzymogenes]MBD5778922.1 hypothetical protein [Pelagicoccus enzymogenes]